MKFFYVSLILCLTLLISGCNEKEDAEKYIMAGADYFKQQNCDKAIENYTKAIQLNPNDEGIYHAYFLRGLTYLVLKNYDKAINDITVAIKLNPNKDEYYYVRAKAYVSLLNYEQAINDCNKAIQINPNYAKAYSHRGYCYCMLQNYKQAMEDCNKAIQLNPKYADAYVDRAFIYHVLQNYDKALNDYNKALEIDPNHELAKEGKNEVLSKINNSNKKNTANLQKDNKKKSEEMKLLLGKSEVTGRTCYLLYKSIGVNGKESVGCKIEMVKSKNDIKYLEYRFYGDNLMKFTTNEGFAGTVDKEKTPIEYKIMKELQRYVKK